MLLDTDTGGYIPKRYV